MPEQKEVARCEGSTDPVSGRWEVSDEMQEICDPEAMLLGGGICV